MFVRPMASVMFPDSMVVFGEIWAFPVMIASHSGRLSKYLRHETLFLGSVVAYWYKLCPFWVARRWVPNADKTGEGVEMQLGDKKDSSSDSKKEGDAEWWIQRAMQREGKKRKRCRRRVIDRENKRNRDVDEQCKGKEIEREGDHSYETPVLSLFLFVLDYTVSFIFLLSVLSLIIIKNFPFYNAQV